MILKTCFFLMLSVAWEVSGASFSKVFVQTGPEVAPAVEYLKYGAPSYTYGSPEVAQYNAAPVGFEYPLSSSYGYATPCYSGSCFYPGQSVASVAQIAPSANVIEYKSPVSNHPVIYSPAQTSPSGYEYSYVIVDQRSGDHKVRNELSDGGVVRGEYSFLQPDGLVRDVQYVADDSQGFIANVENFAPEEHVIHTEVTHHAEPCHDGKSAALTALESHHEHHEAHEEHHEGHQHHPEHETHEPEAKHGHPEHHELEEEHEVEEHHEEHESRHGHEHHPSHEDHEDEDHESRHGHEHHPSHEDHEDEDHESRHGHEHHPSHEDHEDEDHESRHGHEHHPSHEDHEDEDHESRHGLEHHPSHEDHEDEDHESRHGGHEHSAHEEHEDEKHHGDHGHHNAHEDNDEEGEARHGEHHGHTEHESHAQDSEDIESSHHEDNSEESESNHAHEHTPHDHATHENLIEISHIESHQPHEGHHIIQTIHEPGVAESNVYVSYNDIIKCIQAAMTKANTHPTYRPPSPLTYLVLNKPC